MSFKNIMLKLEDIEIIKKYNDEYQIVFNTGDTIHLKTKRVIIPLLLLIKYGKCTNNDLNSIKYDTVIGLIKDKTDITFRNDFISKIKPFTDLITDEGFFFIDREYDNSYRCHFFLDSKDHKLLFRPININTLELEKKSNKVQLQIIQCAYCHKLIKNDNAVIDYIKPIFRGGIEDISNKQILCHDCYKAKRKICMKCLELCDITTCPLYAVQNSKLKTMIITKEKANKT